MECPLLPHRRAPGVCVCVCVCVCVYVCTYDCVLTVCRSLYLRRGCDCRMGV